MLDAIDKNLLKAVAGLDGMPKGAFNIRKNGTLLSREVSKNINIESNEEGTGIVVTVKPGVTGESVHIPVILSQAGLHDVVYNTFIIGEGADVTIVAGCGIHCAAAGMKATRVSMNSGWVKTPRFVTRKNMLPQAVEKANEV